MISLQITCLLLALSGIWNEKVRTIEYNGNQVKTTYEIDQKFYGIYSGRKTGFLELNPDGTGTYQYDVFGFAPSDCIREAVKIEWGLLLDENDNVVSMDRRYGKSYPLLMKSIGNPQFQGCRTEVMLDFIMEYKNGELGISSSDDWIKKLTE